MWSDGNFNDLPSIVASDAVFHSPVGLKPYPGRDVVCLVLRTAACVLERFRYERQLFDGVNAVLEFSAYADGEELKGVHIIRFNGAGEIDDIEKFVRPAKAAIALGNAIGGRAGEQIREARDEKARPADTRPL